MPPRNVSETRGSVNAWDTHPSAVPTPPADRGAELTGRIPAQPSRCLASFPPRVYDFTALTTIEAGKIIVVSVRLLKPA